MKGAWAVNVVMVVLLMAAPFTLAYGWNHWWYTVRRQNLNWRGWVSLACLAVMTITATVGVGLWLYCQARYNGPEQHRTGEFWNFFAVWKIWARPVVRTLAAVAVAGLFGTRRLIPVVFVGAVGGIAWWILPLWMQ